MSFVPEPEIFKDNSDETLHLLRNFHIASETRHLTNSDKITSAQYNTLCQLGDARNIAEVVRRVLSPQNNEITVYEKSIIELMFLHGLRISEALNVRYSDINQFGQITIKGLKGSNDRIVSSINFTDFWLYVRKSNLCFSTRYNRWYFYRLFKKKGISASFRYNKKQSVTHLLRYNYILLLLQNGTNEVNIKNAIGHKNIKSTMRYICKLKNEKKT